MAGCVVGQAHCTVMPLSEMACLAPVLYTWCQVSFSILFSFRVVLVHTAELVRAPHDTLLVVDASVGRNAVDQARTWKKEVG